jgi:hypothetical protein
MTDHEENILDDAIEAYMQSRDYEQYFRGVTKAMFKEEILNSPSSMKSFMKSYWDNKLGNSPSK